MEKLQELEKELKNLESLEFMLHMADHWDDDDYRTSRELSEKIRAKKEEIAKCKLTII